MGPRPFPMKETLKEYLQELKDRAVLDEEAIRDEKEREDAYKIEMADKIKFDVDAEEEPEEKEVSEESAKKMEDSAKDIEKDAPFNSIAPYRSLCGQWLRYCKYTNKAQLGTFREVNGDSKVVRHKKGVRIHQTGRRFKRRLCASDIYSNRWIPLSGRGRKCRI